MATLDPQSAALLLGGWPPPDPRTLAPIVWMLVPPSGQVATPRPLAVVRPLSGRPLAPLARIKRA